MKNNFPTFVTFKKVKYADSVKQRDFSYAMRLKSK